MKATPKYQIKKVDNHYKIMIEAFYKKREKRKFWFGYKTIRVWGLYSTNEHGGVLQTGAKNSSGTFKTFAEAKHVFDYWTREAKPIKI